MFDATTFISQKERAFIADKADENLCHNCGKDSCTCIEDVDAYCPKCQNTAEQGHDLFCPFNK